jgi:hypothetical protein
MPSGDAQRTWFPGRTVAVEVAPGSVDADAH